MALMAEHLTCVYSTFQFLAADQRTGVGFKRSLISLLAALAKVFSRTAAIRALMFPTRAKTSAKAIACRKFVAIDTHFRANPLDLSGSASTINLDHHPTG